MKRYAISLTVSVIITWLTAASSLECFAELPDGFRGDVKDALRDSQCASAAAYGQQAFWTPYARIYPTAAYAQHMWGAAGSYQTATTNLLGQLLGMVDSANPDDPTARDRMLGIVRTAVATNQASHDLAVRAERCAPFRNTRDERTVKLIKNSWSNIELLVRVLEGRVSPDSPSLD